MIALDYKRARYFVLFLGLGLNVDQTKNTVSVSGITWRESSVKSKSHESEKLAWPMALTLGLEGLA